MYIQKLNTGQFLAKHMKYLNQVIYYCQQISIYLTQNKNNQLAQLIKTLQIFFNVFSLKAINNSKQYYQFAQQKNFEQKDLKSARSQQQNNIKRVRHKLGGISLSQQTGFLGIEKPNYKKIHIGTSTDDIFSIQDKMVVQNTNRLQKEFQQFISYMENIDFTKKLIYFKQPSDVSRTLDEYCCYIDMMMQKNRNFVLQGISQLNLKKKQKIPLSISLLKQYNTEVNSHKKQISQIFKKIKQRTINFITNSNNKLSKQIIKIKKRGQKLVYVQKKIHNQLKSKQYSQLQTKQINQKSTINKLDSKSKLIKKQQSNQDQHLQKKNLKIYFNQNSQHLQQKQQVQSLDENNSRIIKKKSKILKNNKSQQQDIQQKFINRSNFIRKSKKLKKNPLTIRIVDNNSQKQKFDNLKEFSDQIQYSKQQQKRNKKYNNLLQQFLNQKHKRQQQTQIKKKKQNQQKEIIKINQQLKKQKQQLQIKVQQYIKQNNQLKFLLQSQQHIYEQEIKKFQKNQVKQNKPVKQILEKLNKNLKLNTEQIAINTEITYINQKKNQLQHQDQIKNQLTLNLNTQNLIQKMSRKSNQLSSVSLPSIISQESNLQISSNLKQQQKNKLPTFFNQQMNKEMTNELNDIQIIFQKSNSFKNIQDSQKFERSKNKMYSEKFINHKNLNSLLPCQQKTVVQNSLQMDTFIMQSKLQNLKIKLQENQKLKQKLQNMELFYQQRLRDRQQKNQMMKKNKILLEKQRAKRIMDNKKLNQRMISEKQKQITKQLQKIYEDKLKKQTKELCRKKFARQLARKQIQAKISDYKQIIQKLKNQISICNKNIQKLQIIEQKQQFQKQQQQCKEQQKTQIKQQKSDKIIMLNKSTQYQKLKTQIQNSSIKTYFSTSCNTDPYSPSKQFQSISQLVQTDINYQLSQFIRIHSFNLNKPSNLNIKNKRQIDHIHKLKHRFINSQNQINNQQSTGLIIHTQRKQIIQSPLQIQNKPQSISNNETILLITEKFETKDKQCQCDDQIIINYLIKILKSRFNKKNHRLQIENEYRKSFEYMINQIEREKYILIKQIRKYQQQQNQQLNYNQKYLALNNRSLPEIKTKRQFCYKSEIFRQIQTDRNLDTILNKEDKQLMSLLYYKMSTDSKRQKYIMNMLKIRNKTNPKSFIQKFMKFRQMHLICGKQKICKHLKKLYEQNGLMTKNKRKLLKISNKNINKLIFQ